MQGVLKMKVFWINYGVALGIGIVASIFNPIFSWGYSMGDIVIFSLLAWIILNQGELILNKNKRRYK